MEPEIIDKKPNSLEKGGDNLNTPKLEKLDSNTELETPKNSLEENNNLNTDNHEKTVENLDSKNSIEENPTENQKKENLEHNESTENNNSSDSSNSKSSEELEKDIIIRKEIDKVLMNDGLDKIYESLDNKNKERFNKEKEKATVKIIDALKYISKNVKKTVRLILKAITKFINSIKGVNNTAYKEKVIKIKVEKILQEHEETKHLKDF